MENTKSKKGWTAFFYIIEKDHTGIILLLLDLQEEVNINDKYNKTILDYAFQFGKEDIAQTLIKTSAK